MSEEEGIGELPDLGIEEIDQVALLSEHLDSVMSEALKPLSRDPTSVWSESNLYLPAGVSSIPGPLRWFEYQRGIVDAIDEPGVHEIVIEKGSRTGYNQILAAWHLRWLATTRDPIVTIHQTEKAAREYEEKYIRPMIEASPELLAVLPNQEDQRWHSKTTLTGSTLTFKEAGKPSNFASYAARLISGDEVDRPQWADGGADISEGDKLDLMEVRLSSFKGRELMINGSSPGLERTSRIHPRFLLTDQRRYFMPCPHCEETQYFEWGGRDYDYGVKWDKGNPAAAYYVCKHCGCVIDERGRREMMKRGEWIPTATGLPGKVGFHMSGLLSPFLSFGDLAGQFEKAARMAAIGRTGNLQTFVNTKLGEVWVEPEAGKPADAHELEERVELYEAEVPQECLFVVATADTQEGKADEPGYHEVAFYGVAPGEQFYLIAQFKLQEYGLDDKRHEVQLASLLSRKWRHASGRQMEAAIALVDCGGNHTSQVVRFCNDAAAKGKRWYPIKGYSNKPGERRGIIWPGSISQAKKGGYMYVVDVDSVKDEMYRRLKLEPGEHGSVHFPSSASSIEGALQIDGKFFKRLTKERPRVVPGTDGTSWANQPRDQEPWDLLVYSYVALEALYSMKGGSKIRDALGGSSVNTVQKKAKEEAVTAVEEATVEEQADLTKIPPWNLTPEQRKIAEEQRAAKEKKIKRQTGGIGVVKSSFVSQ
jgi:phage terminase large subunit GpA-like protein